MSHLHLVVPSALVDPGFAADLLRDCAMPGLQRIADLVAPASHGWPSDAPLTPWQAWVFGLDGARPVDVNVAEFWASACGLPASAGGGRYVVEPAHFDIANDHLRLDDPARLRLTLPEAEALADVAAPLLAEAGWRLSPVTAATLTHWPVLRDDGAPLVAPSIERAVGDNVAAWQPRARGVSDGATPGDPALAWRRCVNEIQMRWFGHAVNDAREAAGAPTVNTVWLSGNGGPRTDAPRFASIASSLPFLVALPTSRDVPRSLESFDALMGPMRGEDWAAWRDALDPLDARIDALIARAVAGDLDALTVVLCGHDRASVWSVDARTLRQRWRGWFRRPPSVVDLLAEVDAE